MVWVESEVGALCDIDVVVEDNLDCLVVDEAAKALIGFLIFILLINSAYLPLI